MKTDHIFDFNYKKDNRITKIFQAIKLRNTILLLGAGASVLQDKIFLSSDLMALYKAKKSFNFDTSDITEFVDILSANNDFSRSDFDAFVDQCLRQLYPSQTHKTLASLNWNSIITTNYDLLIERAFEQIKDTVDENKSLKVIRSQQEKWYTPSDDEILYYKLNGCIYDKSKYPLVFSSEDFSKSDNYYKSVLLNMRSMSDKIVFLAIGYSFTDLFSKKLLQRIDSYKFRERRILYCVEPFINTQSLPWFTQNKICLINTTVDDFFLEYKKWEEEEGREVRLPRKNYYTNIKDAPLYSVSSKAMMRTDGNLLQLNDNYRSRFIKEVDFYKGEEPDFGVIQRNYDIVKARKINDIKNLILEKAISNASKIIPLIFLTGTFGTGKSTFAYRLLKTLIDDASIEAAAYEILDPARLKVADLRDIFSKTSAKLIFLYINSFEVNSVFKALIDLRGSLSIDFSPEYKIIIISTIRQNIYEKWSLNKNHSNSNLLEIDCKLNKDETSRLLDKLKACNLVTYRDAREKNEWERKIQKEYDGDSYISLLKIVAGNKLLDDLFEAYSQLNEFSKTAFEYTSFVYQFKIPMPVSILKSLINVEWDVFRKQVIEVDGKGILLQEEISQSGIDSDLFFRTKHPVISQELIQFLYPELNAKFRKVKSIITHIVPSQTAGRFLVDFLKALEGYNYFTRAQIQELYDTADKTLIDDPHFLLHYAINLQHRNNQQSIDLAIQKILYAESLLDYRNHYFIHRRGVLHFKLAQMMFEKGEDKDYLVRKHLTSAVDLLEIKRVLDPCSAYAYFDLIKLHIWYLENYEADTVEELTRRIHIDELFDTASKTVYDNYDRIINLRKDYISAYQFKGNEQAYTDFIEQKFASEEERPYALVLLFNFFYEKSDQSKITDLLEELEGFTYNIEVVRTLFNYYGRNLYNANTRKKYFTLVKENDFLNEKENLKFNYYSFMAESYNYHFSYAFEFQRSINSRYHTINPDFSRYWIDSLTNEPQIFEGILKVNHRGKKVIYIPHLTKNFFINHLSKELELKKTYDVNLRFFLYGIRAEILKTNENDIQIADESTKEDEEM